MAINRDKPDKWKADIAKSVDFYNEWFMKFAPKAFRETRIITAKQVEDALVSTDNLLDISVDALKRNPSVLPILRMSTCPPIARDRLVGLAGVSKNLVGKMEDSENPSLPPRMDKKELDEQLGKIAKTIRKMADPDIFVWLNSGVEINETDVQRAATIVADRLCGAVSDPIIRNAQEKRQLATIQLYLENKGYTLIDSTKGVKYDELNPGEFSFRTNVPVRMNNSEMKVNIPVDVVIQPLIAEKGDFPLLLEAKSAGDFTNVNKRRKEEAQKMQQLKNTYGDVVRFGLFLCGYFDSGYLGYEAAEGIDWIWEHRVSDLEKYGL